MLESSELLLELMDSGVLRLSLCMRLGGFDPGLHLCGFAHDRSSGMCGLVAVSCLNDHDHREGTWGGSD